jgi:hypothetical protein
MRQITLDQPFNQRRLGLLKYLVSYFGSPGSTGGWVEEPLMIESERLDNEFLMTESDQDLNPFAAFDTTADIYMRLRIRSTAPMPCVSCLQRWISIGKAYYGMPQSLIHLG